MIKIKRGKIECAFCGGTGVLPETETMDIKCPACWGKSFVYLEKATECVFCAGKGRKTAHYNLPCQVCKGVGAIRIKDTFKSCPDCKGAGKMPGKFLPCLTCQGK